MTSKITYAPPLPLAVKGLEIFNQAKGVAAIEDRLDYIIRLFYKLKYNSRGCMDWYDESYCLSNFITKKGLIHVDIDTVIEENPTYQYQGKTYSIFDDGFPLDWLYQPFEEELYQILQQDTSIKKKLPALKNIVKKLPKEVKLLSSKHFCQDCLAI